MGDYSGIMTTVAHNHCTALIGAMGGGAVQTIHCAYVDFSALANDALLEAFGFRGLQSFAVRRSVVRSGLITDALIRASVASGLHEL